MESVCRNSAGIGSRPNCTCWARRWLRCDLCFCCGGNIPGFLTDLSSSGTCRKTIYQEIYKSSCSPWVPLTVLSVWNRVKASQCYLSQREKTYLIIIGATDNKSFLLFSSTSFNFSSCISAWYSGIWSIVFFICDIDENSHSFKIMHQIVTVQWPCSRIICTKSQNQIALSFNGISVVPADTGTTEVGRSRVDQVISSSWYEHSIFCNCPCLCFRAIMQKCLVESHSCTLLR